MGLNNNNKVGIRKIPDKDQFVNFLKDKFWEDDIQENWLSEIENEEKKENLAKVIYDLLFIKEVKDITQELSTLLQQGNDILEHIKQEYSELQTFIERIQWETIKNLLSSPIREGISLDDPEISIEESVLLYQEVSLFNLFAQEKNNTVINLVWEPFLKYVKTHIGKEEYNNILQNLTEPTYKNWIFTLSASSELHYDTFDDNYKDTLESFLDKTIGYGHIEYVVPVTNSGPWKIDSKRKLDHEWDNFKWESVKSDILALAMQWKKVYLQWEYWSGKTHLLQWLVKKLAQEYANESFIYMTGQEFYNEYMDFSEKQRLFKANNATGNKPNDFYKKFRGKVVFIDGIEPIFTWKKLGTRETFLTICESTKQVFFSWHYPLWELKIPRDTWTIKIMDEISNLGFMILQNQDLQIKRDIIRNYFAEQWTLFTQNLNLDEISNVLIDHSSIKHYEQIINWYIRQLKWDEKQQMGMREFIETLMWETIKLPVDDIISSIKNVLLEDEELRSELKSMGIIIIDSELDMPIKTLMENIKNRKIAVDSTLGFFVPLITHYIHDTYTEKTREEISQITGKSNASAADSWMKEKLKEKPRVNVRIYNSLFNALCKKYWFTWVEAKRIKKPDVLQRPVV